MGKKIECYKCTVKNGCFIACTKVDTDQDLNRTVQRVHICLNCVRGNEPIYSWDSI